MKISVFIPCIPEHFLFLDTVLECYAHGPETPDEIVILMSNCQKVKYKYYMKSFINSYENSQSIKVKLFMWEKLLYTGEACNYSKDYCTGDIIVIQAADDLPHERRIEVVKDYFDKYDIVSLNHSYYGKSHIDYYGMAKLHKMAVEKLKNIKVIQPFEIFKHVTENPDDVYGQFCGFPVAAGTICHRKEILKEVEWTNLKHGQDTLFCKEVIKKYKKSIIIDAPLYFYNK